MKVFLSWSGDLSHQIACALRDWLPSVIQSVSPYVSSEDIDKGTRWSTDIATELEESQFGVICVTRENLIAPWVNFEAGALSKTIDKSNVTPLLYNIKRSEVRGPLLQFQSTVCEEGDVLKLVQSINKRTPDGHRLSDKNLLKAFEVWWPRLESQLSELPDSGSASKPPKAPASANSDLLEEVLNLVRLQQRILNDPEVLLPAAYLRSSLRGMTRGRAARPWGRLHSLVIDLERAIEQTLPNHEEIGTLMRQVHDEVHQCSGDTHEHLDNESDLSSRHEEWERDSDGIPIVKRYPARLSRKRRKPDA